MPTAHLDDRGVVRVRGDDAKRFLDGLITCDLDRIGPGTPRFGALLTPQGKILFDFIVFEKPDDAGTGYLLDVDRNAAPDLVRRLGFYKLRAKVAVEDLSEALAVVAGWGDAPRPERMSIAACDPRLPALGWRALVAATDAPSHLSRLRERSSDAEGGDRVRAHDIYHAHRIALGVPEGGKDFSWSDAFPHEALMDQLHGVDFDKGCYVGQEVVSRMQHRGTARTRIVPLVYPGGEAAEPGAPVTAGARALGKAGTGAAGRGLAMIRLERLGEAVAAGETVRAGGLLVRVEKPAFATFPFPGEAATPAA
jgi:tRNA-modifying protein YgfZ